MSDMLVENKSKTPHRVGKKQQIILDHNIFDSHDGWKKSESMPHPTLKLELSTDPSDYNHIKGTCPNVYRNTLLLLLIWELSLASGVSMTFIGVDSKILTSSL